MSRLHIAFVAAVLLWSCTVEVGRSTGRASGSLGMSRDEALLYAADADNGLLVVFDAASLTRLHEVKVGTRPARVLVGADDTLYISNRGSRSVSVIHRGEWQVAAELPTGIEPNGLALAKDGKTLYVVSATALGTPRSGTLAAYDTATLEQRWVLPVGEEPRDVAVTDEHHAVVTLFKQGAVVTVVLDPPAVGGTSTIVALNDDGEEAAHARGLGVVVAADDGRAFALGQRSSTLATQLPDAGDLSPMGYLGFLSQGAVFERVSSPSGDTVTFDTGARTIPFVNQGATAAVIVSGSSAWRDDSLFIVNRESSMLDVRPIFGSQSGQLNAFQIDPGTDGIAVRSDPRTLFTYSQFTHQLSKLVRDDSAGGFYGVQTQVSAAPEALDADVALGRRLFFSAKDSSISGNGLACSTCHLEGRDDGHVWQLPQGPRQTPSLAGRQLALTAPYHWQGELATLGAFYDHTVKTLMGGQGLDERSQAAVSKFLESQPAPENPRSAAPTAADTRGRVAFVKAGCDACHRGAALADSASVDVGTGGKYDVPSLLGLGRSAPYLHDGSAPTLEARFAQASGDRHGNVSQLSHEELSDLVAYLETL